MKIQLDVKYANGTSKVIEARFPDFVAFERTWNRSVTKFEQELRLTDLAWIAWHSEKRTKATVKPFDPEWLDEVESLSIVESSEESETPLDETQPTGA